MLTGQRGGAGLQSQGRQGHGEAPGKIRLGVLLFILALVSSVYVAIQFIPAYWTYLSMQDPVKEAALTAVTARGGEETARADLLRKARDIGLRITEENIEFIRDGRELVVRVSWAEPVDLPRYRHTLRFQVEQRISLR